ncbi:MAG: molybdopterin molybdotransferase MoeA [Rhodocyclaceae bacterium]|jgi:molybdopterin molybdotransferase|nr:molybdopterin molybdotransferase MoeA [Rhodocyclaceae bacterium]
MSLSDLLSYDEALARLLAAARPLADIETVDTLAARGRVLAADQTASVTVPAQDNSAMDGYAVRCADVPAPGVRLPVSQRIPAGSVGHRLAPGSAARIFTGAPLPAGADAVVMQELCEHAGEEVLINHFPAPGEAVHRAGEDMQVGRVVLHGGTRLAPQHLAIAAAAGLASLPVRRRLRVAVLCTGNELAMPGQPLPPGGLYNSNRYLVIALLESLGCQVTDLGIVPDSLAATREALRQAARGQDLILSCGGVSVGEEDHVKPAVEAEGALLMWKIALKPGKPLAFGRVGETAFIGLPGNPVSSFVTFLMLVRPYVLACQGGSRTTVEPLLLRAEFDRPRPDQRREFLRARRTADGGVELFPNQGPHVLTSTGWADGLVDAPAGVPIGRGEAVRFLPFSELLG